MLERLREVSARFGADPMHVQGPGGNTSLKLDNGKMWIKASGFELRNALREEVFALVDSVRIVQRIAAQETDPLYGSWDNTGLKPSIETTLHALMPERVVLHTHSITAIATACRVDAVARLAELLPDIPHAFVPYAKPGIELALGVMRALEAAPAARVVILGNHGIVVSGDTPELAAELLLLVTDRLAAPVRSARRADLTQLESLAQAHALMLPADPVVHQLAQDEVNLAIATSGTLYPDHVVFLGSGAGILAERERLRSHPALGIPKLWIAPDVGVLLEPGLPPAAHAMARCLADTVSRLPEVAACSYLSAAQEGALLGMEEEKYRQELARRKASS